MASMAGAEAVGSLVSVVLSLGEGGWNAASAAAVPRTLGARTTAATLEPAMAKSLDAVSRAAVAKPMSLRESPPSSAARGNRPHDRESDSDADDTDSLVAPAGIVWDLQQRGIRALEAVRHFAENNPELSARMPLKEFIRYVEVHRGEDGLLMPPSPERPRSAADDRDGGRGGASGGAGRATDGDGAAAAAVALLLGDEEESEYCGITWVRTGLDAEIPKHMDHRAARRGRGRGSRLGGGIRGPGGADDDRGDQRSRGGANTRRRALGRVQGRDGCQVRRTTP
mmetsp:Transcript_12255/g.43021  ORF Transcript_12255/g.43021 Transcript_12255/m.43021 type:complete len:283 (-) Transcript_12255:451-1299(-)